MNDTVVIVTGAAPLSPETVARVSDTAIVLAADGALDHALAAGLRPAGLVGDLDSVSADGLAWATDHATISRHDPDKDHTDTELALRVAVDLDPARLILISGGGNRLDHTFAAIGALGHPSLTSIGTIEAWWDDQHVRVVHGPGRAVLHLERGATLSILALHGSCHGVTIDGTEWRLDDDDLHPLVGRGLSNIVTGDTVEITVSLGVLTVFPAPPIETPSIDPTPTENTPTETNPPEHDE